MLQPGTLQRVDDMLARLVARHAGQVPDLDLRLNAAGLARGHAPSWETLETIAPRAKADLPALQRAHPPFGGLAPDFQPRALFWSPGGLCEPVTQTSIDRLAQLLADAGIKASDRVANGFSYHFTPAGLLVHEAIVQLGACALPIGPQQIPQAAEFMAVAGATAYIGTASHLMMLLQSGDALSEPLQRPQLRIAMAGAEPFGDDLRRAIESQWHVPCFDFYGFAEAGILALECVAHAGLHLHPEVLSELVVPGTGVRTSDGVGELLITHDCDQLPLLRFATGDLVRVHHEACTCGRRTPRIQPLGRVGDSARVRGMLLHGSQLRAFARRTGLHACRLTLTRDAERDVLHLHYQADAADKAVLAQTFRDVCRLRADSMIQDPTLPKGEVLLRDDRHGGAP